MTVIDDLLEDAGWPEDSEIVEVDKSGTVVYPSLPLVAFVAGVAAVGGRRVRLFSGIPSDDRAHMARRCLREQHRASRTRRCIRGFRVRDAGRQQRLGVCR